ncbi:MAG: hypothetical protein LUH15_08880 [Tannerellaceae bacterium]|nr:hypothetical protein [Tannerellaceae bacterium]
MNKCKQQTVPAILKILAHLLGAEIKDHRFEIPEKYGRGYCAGFVFNEHIRMIISNYELNGDIPVENPETDPCKRIIFFKFQNIFPKTGTLQPVPQSEGIPSVLIATSRINTNEIISIHTNTATINIEADADYLKGLFDLSGKSPVLESLQQNTQPLLFEQLIYPSLQKIVDEIVTEKVSEVFELFFCG